ncbi:MAG: Ribosomal protein L15 [Candidatus Giovannonibacteria bacterium GW2011_GWC2_44_9]|uniref:50S ribosomal protein L15 n=3 Tax=Candidatus Giovannoniibacteriota TaxID=1752738 RepID=A0A0G1IYG9_9BACT|nr:MAG: Ribosomal protein L15 [Candidatus Giovannonibacteria bacterium GW2011_GWB1_44_23]KKT64038.1 MAG: Ribosomal protein L15 [Candidatus Giovannonibacteria bacterium GW2011_GWA1_44_29]KKT83905.1 MAG: Ribosomal protein L15 [Candidatus Giovannonibacteria bacterium GW2011_GWC2_44_9]KKT91886.1 MAG: Ribosomal protein L15 [Parcubacteria group bacterium GW2011_GWC1_45_13]
MQVHNLLKSNNKKAKRIGRGGKRGSFSGRGIKGQKSRSGRKIRPQIRDIIKKMHKRRGYGRNRAQSVNASKAKPAVVNWGALDKAFKDGEKVTAKLLIERGLIKLRGNKFSKVKILGDGLPHSKAGNLSKKLVFDKNILMSKSVKEKIG